MAKKTIEDIQVNGKKVLVRCDFNVPMDENKVITDENRLRGALPTIQYLIKNGAKVILCSHLGRPKGEFNMKYSLRPVAERLSQLLGQEVKMADDVIGESAHKLASELKDGEVMLLENVRFHKEEEKNDAVCLTAKMLLMQGIATSIDALAVGVSFAALDNVNIAFAASAICCITFAFSVVGVFIGKKFGTVLNNKAQLVGGIILVGIGIKIFVEHTFFS